MALGRFFGKFFGRTIGDAASFAIGGSISRTIDPVLQQVENEAWLAAVTAGAVKPLSPGDAAEIVAEDVALEPWGKHEAAQTGIGGTAFEKLLGATLNGPGLGYLFEAWRRDELTDAQFVHGLRKAKLEGLWDGPLKSLRDVLLSPAELANARQQGFVSPERQRAEASLQGVTKERADIQFETVGLPPGPATAQAAANRNLIDRATFDQMIREGHTKTKYTDLEWELRVPVLSAAEYAGLRIRGWITAEESYAGGELTGHTREQMEQLFLNRGRPATTHQVWIGLQRGGKLTDANLTERETFDRAVKQSDIRPEYSELLWAQRYTYPSAFVLRALTGDGTFTRAQTEQILKESGWRPDLAEGAARKWATAGTSGAREATSANLRAEYEGLHITRPELLVRLEALGYGTAEAEDLADLGDYARVKKYRDAVMVAVHKAYIGHELQAAEARAKLVEDRITPDAADELLKLWALELSISRKTLSDAQIVAAYRRTTLSEADATAELISRGYSPHDAAVRLGLTPVP